MNRRAATKEDVPFLLVLRQHTMDAYLVEAGVPTTTTEHLARVRYRFDCAEILMDEDTSVGLLKMTRDASQWKIIQLQLLPELQGRGLGSKLLAQVKQEAQTAQASLVLSVLKTNPARRLYERMGFIVVGESEQEFDMVYRG